MGNLNTTETTEAEEDVSPSSNSLETTTLPTPMVLQNFSFPSVFVPSSPTHNLLRLRVCTCSNRFARSCRQGEEFVVVIAHKSIRSKVFHLIDMNLYEHIAIAIVFLEDEISTEIYEIIVEVECEQILVSPERMKLILCASIINYPSVKLIDSFIDHSLMTEQYVLEETQMIRFILEEERCVRSLLQRSTFCPTEEELHDNNRIADLNWNGIGVDMITIPKSFPQQCWFLIMSYCDLQTLGALSSASKELKQITESTIWKYIYCQLVGSTEKSVDVSYIQLCSALVNHYQIIGSHDVVLKHDVIDTNNLNKTRQAVANLITQAKFVTPVTDYDD